MPGHVPATSVRERDETSSQRADRNSGEALQELRVAQAAVQVLFGFLLAVALSGRFPADRLPFVWTLTAALLLMASMLLAVWLVLAFLRSVAAATMALSSWP